VRDLSFHSVAYRAALFENDSVLTGNFNESSEEISAAFFRVDKADIFSVDRGGRL
jgi:hypothetical protein